MKVTVAPLMGFPPASVTTATSGLVKAVLIGVVWLSPDEMAIVDAVPATTVKLTGVTCEIAPPEAVADAPIEIDPASAPVTVSIAMPPEAVTEVRPVTEPVPVVWPKVTLNELSLPVVTVLPLASSMVAVIGRVAPAVRLPVAPDNTIFVAGPVITSGEEYAGVVSLFVTTCNPLPAVTP